MATYSDPTVVTPTIRTRPAVQTGAVITCVAGVLSLLIAGYILMQRQSWQQRLDRAENQVKQLDAEEKGLSDAKVKLDRYNKAAGGLHALYDNQKHWEAVFNALQDRLYKKMALTQFQVDDTGKFTLSGYTPDYTQYAKIYSSFTDAAMAQYFVKVRPTSVGIAGADSKDKSSLVPAGYVTFSFELTLSDSIMKAGSASEVQPAAADAQPTTQVAQ